MINAAAEELLAAAAYLRRPAPTIEDVAVKLRRLDESCGPLADLLEYMAGVAEHNARRGYQSAEQVPLSVAVARVLNGGRS